MSYKKVYFSYFILAGILFGLLNLPSSITSFLRGGVSGFEEGFAKQVDNETMQLHELKAENTLLKEQIAYVRDWLQAEDRLDTQFARLQEYLGSYDLQNRDFLQRRIEDLFHLLEKQTQYLSARVVFREPTTWSSALWIDRGEIDNRKIGRTILAKGSPVLLGNVAVGVIEEVKEEKSRVRLITDSSLALSVRALRLGQQELPLIETLTKLREIIALRSDIKKQYPSLVDETNRVLQEIKEPLRGFFLAKGELYGSSYPLWRSRSSTLKGVGFNYEFADKEGKSRNIHEKEDPPLLEVGDLLVTTGFDGIFPAGLHVAHVSKIFSLKEGAPAYELEAESAAGDINSLQFVQVIPPIFSKN